MKLFPMVAISFAPVSIICLFVWVCFSGRADGIKTQKPLPEYGGDSCFIPRRFSGEWLIAMCRDSTGHNYLDTIARAYP